MNKPSIAILLNNFSDGGAEAFVFDLLKCSIEDKSIRFSAVLLNNAKGETNFRRLDYLIEKKIPFLGLGKFGLGSIIQVAIFFKRQDVQLAHAHNLFSVFVAIIAFLAIGKRPKVVFTQHTNHLKRPFLHKFFFSHFIGAYVAICEPAYINMIKVTKHRNVRKIYNGVPLFNTDRKVKTREDKIRLVTIGRFSEEKGHKNLLYALSILKKKGELNDFMMYLIGDGELLSETEALAFELGLDSDIEFMGRISSARNYLSCFDVLVVPSSREGLPIVALESLMVGVPIVSTMVGGMGELVRDKINGLLCEPDSPQALADALLLIKSMDLSDLSKGARSEGIKYTIENSYQEHKKLYQQLLCR